MHTGLGVSPCRDQVSQFICNVHSRFHGLIYKVAHYTNGDNDTWSRINTYVHTMSNLDIPLFKTQGNATLLSEIQNFTMNVCQMYPGLVKRELLAEKVSCLLCINAISDSCKIGGWLDEETSYLFIRGADRILRRYQNLPRLHKILFYYTKPSTTINGNTQLHLTDNALLNWQPSTSSYSFSLIGKQLLLKYTNDESCIATPIVLSGKRTTTPNSNIQVFQPIRDNHMYC
uniref:VP39 n=1 Tax=Nilaparvata lugens endogenous nudivirus TaxID=1487700 RepID=X5GW89_9VIRU|nr:VP39 [Nilaparvata lugens endogenous nudivirus]